LRYRPRVKSRPPLDHVTVESCGSGWLMSSPTSADPRSPSRIDESYDPRRWIYGGLAALFVLIGVSIALSVAAAVWRNQPLSWSVSSSPWDWILGLVGIIIAIWIVVWVVRLIFWGVTGGPYYGPGWRHYYRHDYAHGPFGPDSAVEIARERYARGEITQEQFDQMMRQLGKGSGPLPPA
jgi:uncharacterized membrane protein